MKSKKSILLLGILAPAAVFAIMFYLRVVHFGHLHPMETGWLVWVAVSTLIPGWVGWGLRSFWCDGNAPVMPSTTVPVDRI